VNIVERVARRTCRIDCDKLLKDGHLIPCSDEPCDSWSIFVEKDHFVACVSVLIESLEEYPMDGVSALDRLKALMVEYAMTRGDENA
jgi:hypothetical protein